MSSKSCAQGPSAPDWDAFEELQNRSAHSRDGYALDCVDQALNDLLKNPERASSGQALAVNVLGSARKKVKRRRELVALYVQQAAANENVEVAPLPHEQPSREMLSQAVGLLLGAFKRLPLKEQLLLLQKSSELLPTRVAAASPGVQARQARNLLRRARERLQRAELREAFQTVWLAIEHHPDIANELVAGMLKSVVSAI